MSHSESSRMPSQISYHPSLAFALPIHLEGMDSLIELALDFRWSWNHGLGQLWEQLDAELWDLTRNPWVVLKTVAWEKLERVLRDPQFRQRLDHFVQERRAELSAPAWFQKQHPHSPLRSVAYFSMEFMLSEALPIYSGGLGNVAGDQLKAASDLGVPIIGIGLLYQQGYFRQIIDKNGNQQALYPYNDPGQLPITALRKENGEWLRIQLALPGYSLTLRAWQVQVGRVGLYLLDSNDAANNPVYRGITSELYGGGPELRLQQELILGMGGWRLLEELGIRPTVCHLNEGHAAFVVLERAKNLMKEMGLSFAEALIAARAGNLFTTHTAVPAGFDRFSPALIEQYLGQYAWEELHLSSEELLALGRENRHNPSEYFNMAYLAIRGSGSINGVSQLHQQVSRQLFVSLFPRWNKEEIPVGAVTNGVHVPSWESKVADKLWEGACGKERWLSETAVLKQKLSNLPHAKIWQMRNQARASLVDYTRERLSRQLTMTGLPKEMIELAHRLFDPHVLTIGFARRFAIYKRPNMLLHNRERLLRILNHPTRPVQLIIAGKAHPADQPGQALIREWTNFIREPAVRPHAVFLSDYDMLLTEKLAQGVDVWINTPRRPWEACGTSGMKVLANGGLNLSELDGWWVEAYTSQVGWALGDGKEHGDDPVWDAIEAEKLYDLLENEIVPEFYARNEEGIPINWVERIRSSMALLTPQFSANRAVRQYTEQEYLPAAARYEERVKEKAELSRKIFLWEQEIFQQWENVRITDFKVERQEAHYLLEVTIHLSALAPSAVKVELFANTKEGEPPWLQEMALVRDLGNQLYTYQSFAPLERPESDYTPRVIPHFLGVSIPLEMDRVLWQK